MTEVYPKRELINEAFAGQKEVISKLLVEGQSQPSGKNRIKRKGYRTGYTGYTQGGYMGSYNGNNVNNTNNNHNNNNNNNNNNNYQQISRNDDYEVTQQSLYYTPGKNFSNLASGQYGNQSLANQFTCPPTQVFTHNSSLSDSSTESTPVLPGTSLTLGTYSSCSTITHEPCFSEKTTTFQFDPFKPVNLNNKYEVNLANFDNITHSNSIWNNNTNTVWG